MAETVNAPNNAKIAFRGKAERERKMAKLTAAARDKIPSSEFAEPKERKFPVENKNHAGNAKARAAQMAKRGLISPAEKAKIDAKANKVLGESAEEDEGDRE